MVNFKTEDIKKAVREGYAQVALSGSGCCSGESCSAVSAEESLLEMGYKKDELAAAPEGSNMGLGCGNPQAIASLKKGEVVLDLGSGGGFDCFLASRSVGAEGSVIGVDMTPEMIAKARENALKNDYQNVDFRLGEIENLPVKDSSIDVIISNCVINLSTDKQRVYNEAYRVLKNGGRVAISDVVLTSEIPESMHRDLNRYTACITGAAFVGDIETMLKEAGFTDIKITPKDESKTLIKRWSADIEDFIISANIEARKRSSI